MRLKKLLAIGCVTVMAAACVAGCGSDSKTDKSAQENESSVSEESETVTVKVTEIDGNKITAVIGELSQQNGGENSAGGTPPDMPSGNGENGENSDDSAPPDIPSDSGQSENVDGDTTSEKTSENQQNEENAQDENGNTSAEAPSGEAPNGEEGAGGSTPPEKPQDDGQGGSGDGNTPPNLAGGAGGSSFVESDEEITFTIDNDTVITIEYLQGTDEGTIDSIAVGSVLEVTLDGNNTALTVTVKNLNAGSGFGGSSEVTNGTSANTIDEAAEIEGQVYTSEGDDENALRIDGAEVTLDGITVEKTAGSSSNTENGDFYGQNAALLALNGAEVTITNATVNTSAVNGNGVFSYGEGTVVNIYDSVIRTTENNSGGIQTTGGGTTNAVNLDVETQGNSAAAIRSDRGGGTVNVTEGTYVTNGTGSPAVYCTADITVTDAALTANSSEGVVVEGKNSVTLVNCDVTGNMDNTYNGDSDENIHCIMIYQSMSGDAAVGKAYFSAEDGSITSLSGDMFYITNTDCTIEIKNVTFTLANDTFLRVEGNSSSRGWGTEGANGGDVVLNAQAQEITGNILVDEISSLDLTLSEGSVFTGAINPDGEAGEVNVTIDEASTWTLTADSYITSLDGDTSNIVSNGYHLYVNGEEVL